MKKRIQHNRGFTLIELLIGVAILSIMMIMMVQFMSTTSGSYRKTKKNMNVQTEAMQTMEQLSDTLMQAKYIRVASADQKAYTLTSKSQDDTGAKVTTKDSRKLEEVTSVPYLGTIDYDFVPDNYGNYVNKNTTSRKVIVDFDTYEIVATDGTAYPITDDYDFADGLNPVRSFRTLKAGDTNYYIKPEYIYIEYASKTSTGADITGHVMFYIKDDSIYLYRYQSDDKTKGYAYAKSKADALAGTSGSVEGLLTKQIQDFYLSADTDGNAVLLNVMFENGGYLYNAVEPVIFRNSNVLTVRPQNLYKKADSGGTTQDPDNGTTKDPSEIVPGGEGSGGTSGEDSDT